MEVKKYDYVVLGAGLAGLSFAWKVSKEGKKVLLLEKENTVGGLSRTISKNGFLMDFCAHRFHTSNKELMDTILSLKGVSMKKHLKKSRIYMFGKYLKYPFQLPNLFRAMPFNKVVTCGFDYVLTLFRSKFSKLKVISYKDWFVSQYGEKLYQIMCYPYTSKIWHIDPKFISSDWADSRFGGQNLMKLLKKSIIKLVTFDFSKYDLSDDSLAPDGGEFFYPSKGIQELPDGFARGIKENNGEIECCIEIKSVNTKKKIVTFVKNNNIDSVSYKNLISTIPLTDYYWLQDKRNLSIEKNLVGLKYMDIVFVYVFLKKKRVSNDHWIYFPDKDIPFNRAVEFSNWSDKMVSKGKTCVCFDITCYEGDVIWNKSDKVLSTECIESADRINYFNRDDVIGTYVKKVKYAYPVYDLSYKKNLDKVVKYLEDSNVSLLGRSGIFKYNNADNSIEMAFHLAENYLSNTKNKSLNDYKIKKISL